MPTVSEVHARITGDASGLVKAFKEAETASSNATKTMSEKAHGAADAMGKIALPAAAVAAGAGLIIKDMTTLASEAEQNVGAVESVFKGYADNIKGFSNSAATDVGISKSEYQKFSSVVGSQLKNLGMPMEEVAGGTNDLIKKGADLASMFGGTTSEAVGALSSLLRGERDPIERYGVSMKEADVQAKMAAMGLEGLSGEAEKQAKLQATLAILNDQTADATGNFAREADTAAGAQQRATARLEDAKTVMGEAFLPAMTRGADIVSELSRLMVEHKAILVPLIVTIAGLATGLVVAAGIMKGYAIAVDVVTFAHKMLAMSFMGMPLGWLLLAIGALVGGFVLLWNNVEGFRNFWIDLWNGIVSAMTPVVDTISNAIGMIIRTVTTLWEMLMGNYDGATWLLHMFPVEVVVGIIQTISNFRLFIMDAFYNVQVFLGQVFAAIPGIVQGFLDFMSGTAMPILSAIFQGIGAVAMWLWNNIFIPVFNGIMFVVMGFVGFFQAIWPGIQTVFVLIGDVAVWLWTGVIVPAFNGIMAVVGFMVDWFMTFVWPSLSSIFISIGTIFMNLWTGTFSPVIGFIGTAFFWLLDNVIAPVFNTIMTVISAVVNWFMDYAWPVIQTVIGFIGTIFFWLMTNVVGPVFGFILGTIANFVAWLAGDAQPMISAIFSIIGNTVSWLWEFVVKPVFDFIVSCISTAVTIIKAVFDGLIWFFNNVLVPVFWFLINFVVIPVFDAIAQFIKTTIMIVTAIFDGLVWFFNNVIAPLFWWFWNNVITPVFEGIQRTIKFVIDVVTAIFQGIMDFVNGPLTTAFNILKDTFNTVWETIKNIFSGAIDWIRNTVLQPFIDFFNGIPGVFEGVRDAIGTVWDGIKEKFAGPIRFVVNTVLNDGIINGYNKLNDIVSLPDIPRLNLGFADGGFTGNMGKYQPAGVVHGGEYVINKEATDHIRRTQGMGFLDGLNHGKTDFQDRNKQMVGPGTSVFGSVSMGFQLQKDILAQRKLNVVGGSGNYNIPEAASMWNGLAAVEVGSNLGSTAPTVTVATGVMPTMAGGGSAAGYYQATGIKLDGKDHGASANKVIAVHEIGHALGLPHAHSGADAYSNGNNTNSIMNYNTQFATGGSPTQGDIKALRDIYPGEILGKQGEHTGGGPNGGGGGGGNLGDGIRELIQGLKDKINKAFPEKNVIKDFGLGIVDKVGNAMAAALDAVGNIGKNIVDNVKDMFGQGVNRWRDTAKRALEHTGDFSEETLNTLMRRMDKESGGNPNAVNNWDSNAAAGIPSKGLMQTVQPTFDQWRDKSLKNDIFDPMANIVASINYTKGTYGSLAAGWNMPGGYSKGGLVPKLYDDGGMLPPGLTLTNNASGRPETVLTDDQIDRMGGGGFNGTVIVQIGDEQIEAKLVRIAEDVVDDAAGTTINAARRSRGISR